MCKGLISVIVPVFNVEKYLTKCLDSIINQSYKELEIILIDDGSVDTSGQICEEYSARDNRIIVIHQENHGAAYAKNVGLCNATGEYLSFVDSDDFLQNDAYEFMVKQLEDYDADIIQCSFKKVYQKYSQEVIKFNNIQQLDSIDYLKEFTNDWTCGLLWDKLFKKNIFDGIFFKLGHKIDDEFFTYRGVMNSNKVLRVPHYIYNYRQRISSVMYSSESQAQIISDTLEYLSIRREEVTRVYPQLKKIYDEHFLTMLIILSRKEYVNDVILKSIKRYIKEYYKKANKIQIPISLWIELKKLEFIPIKFLIKDTVVNKKVIEEDLYYQ